MNNSEEKKAARGKRLQLVDIHKYYDNGVHAVRGVSLDVEPGEFLVLVGPSGCGKSTMLRMLAGLEELSRGDILLDDHSIAREAPKNRDVAMVFQNYALYPTMRVYDNMAFPLKMRRWKRDAIRQRVMEVAQQLDLVDYLRRRPAQLSGGQRQRVALGRAMVREPALFLMDEPLSNLDAELRVQTRHEIVDLQRKLGITTVYVTHDQVEAMTMGTRIAVLKDGVLQQYDTPRQLYHRPGNTFVARFIGSPPMNLWAAAFDDEYHVTIGEQMFEMPQDVVDVIHSVHEQADSLVLGWRPEDLYRDEKNPLFFGTIHQIEHVGRETFVYFEMAGWDEWCIWAAESDVSCEIGEQIGVSVQWARMHIFDADSGLRLEPGNTL